MTIIKQEKNFGSLLIPIPRLAICTVMLPFTAFFLCIYYSLRNNFAPSTATHCGVKNYLPSISSAIGEFVPQRYIWRLAVALHSAPRFMMAGLYYSYLKNILPSHPTFKKLRVINAVLNVIEIFALLGLTFVSSRENYDLHKFFFVIFMVCSELYMALTCLLLRSTTKINSKPLERLAYIRKKQLFTLNVCCFFVGLYFYHRHNSYCEPGMYTVFAFMEYIVVLSNMGFHLTAYYDFYEHELAIGEKQPPS